MAPGPTELLIILGFILAGALLGLAVVALLFFLLRRSRPQTGPTRSGPGTRPRSRPTPRQPKWY